MARSKLTTAEVRAALRARYPAAGGAWAFLEEVRNGTGFQRSARSADALAMSLWPSRGLEVHGIEIKVSRADWLRELKEPAKADEVFRFCDRWWVAAGAEDIVLHGELPPTWGLLIPRGKGLVVKVEAVALEPQPITRLFLASLLRNARAADAEAPEAQVALRVAERIEHLQQVYDQQVKSTEQRMGAQSAALREQVARFEAASGIRITQWNGQSLGEAVSVLLASADQRRSGEWERIADEFADLAARVRRAAGEVARLSHPSMPTASPTEPTTR